MNISASLDGTPIECRATFDVIDPTTVVLTMAGVDWLIGRELLRRGLDYPAGVPGGAVEVRPSRLRPTVAVTVRSVDGTAEVCMDRAQLREFIDGTYAEVSERVEAAIVADEVELFLRCAGLRESQ